MNHKLKFPLQIPFQSVISKPQFKGIPQPSASEKQDNDAGVLTPVKNRDCCITSVLKTSVPPPLLSVKDNTVTISNREHCILDSSNNPQKPEISQLVMSPVCDSSLNGRSIPASSALQQNFGTVKNEILKVVPSRRVNPCFTTDVSSPTGYKVSVPSATQSGSVQVIDLTRHCSLDTHLHVNGVTTATPSSHTKCLSVMSTSQVPKEASLNSVTRLCNSDVTSDPTPHVITRNGSTSSTSTKG